MKMKIGMLVAVAALLVLTSLSTQYTFAQEQTVSVTFIINGIGDDALTSPVLNVDGVNYTASDLPLTFNWEFNTTHTFKFYSPVYGQEYTYFWESSSGLTTTRYGAITATENGTITATYYNPLYPSPAHEWLSELMFGELRWLFIIIMLIIVGVLDLVGRRLGNAGIILFALGCLILAFFGAQYFLNYETLEDAVCGLVLIAAAFMLLLEIFR